MGGVAAMEITEQEEGEAEKSAVAGGGADYSATLPQTGMTTLPHSGWGTATVSRVPTCFRASLFREGEMA